FAATKADHLHHTQHPRLTALVEAMLREARDRARFSGAETAALSLAALRATVEETRDYSGRAVDVVRGRLMDGRQAAVNAGELPEDPARLLAPARDGAGRLIPCADGEAGELIGRIGRLPSERFDGYLDPQATAAKILRDGFAEGDAWFRTGDLLRRDADGDYFFVDRVGDTFRWKGENVSTQAVAQALAGAGGVEALAVYGVAVPGQEGRAGMAAVVAQAFDPQAFFAAATGALPPAARPAFVRVVPALPTTSTMKFQTVALKRQGYTDCGDDPVFVRDDEAGTYAPLTPLALGAVTAGSLRL
ncbi:MAG: YcjX family protein, partial [Myxococcales bacterium]|nr:YcjX family protein [Myxococcales bacterium]